MLTSAAQIGAGVVAGLVIGVVAALLGVKRRTLAKITHWPMAKIERSRPALLDEGPADGGNELRMLRSLPPVASRKGPKYIVPLRP